MLFDSTSQVQAQSRVRGTSTADAYLLQQLPSMADLPSSLQRHAYKPNTPEEHNGD